MGPAQTSLRMRKTVRLDLEALNRPALKDYRPAPVSQRGACSVYYYGAE
jgi:hypothetical protein